MWSYFLYEKFLLIQEQLFIILLCSKEIKDKLYLYLKVTRLCHFEEVNSNV